MAASKPKEKGHQPSSHQRITADAATPLPPSCQESLKHLRQAITTGTPWVTAFLEAMELWTLPQEVYKGRLYRYLIQDEAFDCFLLAQRLADQADGLISTPERQLLRQGALLQNVSGEELRSWLGVPKYQTYLNYWYGVTVERALQEVVQEEIRKERVSRGLSPRSWRVLREAFRRLYGEVRSSLMEQFMEDRESPPSPLVSGGLQKEFTYWLFKARVRRSEGARVASDTRKGLEWLQRHHGKAQSWEMDGAPQEDSTHSAFSAFSAATSSVKKQKDRRA